MNDIEQLKRYDNEKVKYRVLEYNPTSAQQGSHSFFAEAVISNEISNAELADKIAARTGVKAYEVTTVIAAIADIISEEVLESNRISLADHTGTKMVSIYPKVNGSVSDADIERETTAAHTADPSVPVRTRAEESDLTTDRLNRAAELNLQQAVCTEQAGSKG
jgi:hypothetical protein